jgi:trehalose 6-phosphate synthase
MRVLRLVLPLLAILGGLAWGASAIVDSLGRRWAEKDVTLRAQLAVRGASETLLHHWERGDVGRLRLRSELGPVDRRTLRPGCRGGGHPARLDVLGA